MWFEGAERRGSEFVNLDLSGVRLRNVDFTRAKVMEATLVKARFSGLIEGLVINDVEVGPLIEAELDRRYPERLKLRPVDAAGVRQAWAVIEELWAATKRRASELPESTLRERVDDEWSHCAPVGEDHVTLFRALPDIDVQGTELKPDGGCCREIAPSRSTFVRLVGMRREDVAKNSR